MDLLIQDLEGGILRLWNVGFLESWKQGIISEDWAGTPPEGVEYMYLLDTGILLVPLRPIFPGHLRRLIPPAPQGTSATPPW